MNKYTTLYCDQSTTTTSSPKFCSSHDNMTFENGKAVTSLKKRHQVFASKKTIRIRVTVFKLSSSGSSREANMADDVNKPLRKKMLNISINKEYYVTN